MKNKFLIPATLFFGILFLTGCKGAKAIQGQWHAQDATGDNCMIEIKESTLVVKKSNEEAFDYKQHSLGTKNGVKYYGITLENEDYSIIFPVKGDETIAMIFKVEGENELQGTLIYALNRQDDPDYYDYAEEYLN